MSSHGRLTPENRREGRQRLIDDQFAVIVRTGDDQERLRDRILNQLRDRAQRQSSKETPLADTPCLEVGGGS